jgi:hypothetical protein
VLLSKIVSMLTEDKYYYSKDVSDFGRQRPSQVIKWSPVFSVEVEENVDFHQHITLLILKGNQKDSSKPKSDKYTKIRPIIREVFLSHFNLALKFIYETAISDGEFYLYQRSKDWWQVKWFSSNEKEKTTIEIDFRDSIEDLWLTFYCIPGHKKRPEFRKNAKPIEIEKFKQFFNLTAQFFNDPDSFTILLQDYIKDFRILCESDREIKGLLISSEKAFEKILQQLEDRKTFIESRLISSDHDSQIDRAKMRGELEGINYAKKVIKMSL